MTTSTTSTPTRASGADAAPSPDMPRAPAGRDAYDSEAVFVHIDDDTPEADAKWRQGRSLQSQRTSTNVALWCVFGLVALILAVAVLA